VDFVVCKFGLQVDMDVNAIGDLTTKGVAGTDDAPKYA